METNNINNEKKVANAPLLRFPEFKDEWNQKVLNDFAKKITKKNKDKSLDNILCNSATLGIIPQVDYFDREIANSDNTAGYYVIEESDFVYNPRKSTSAPYGPVNIYKGEKPGIISPLYLCFKVDGIDKNFLIHKFKGKTWHPFMFMNGDSGVRHDRVSIKDDVFFSMPLFVPSMEEQHKIADFLSLLDKRIEIQKSVIENLKSLKSAIVEELYAHIPNGIIGDYIEQVSDRNKSEKGLAVYSVSNRYGFINQEDQFEDRIVASENTTNYKVVSKNMFAYNPARINVGSIARLKEDIKVIISPMYVCFRTKNGLLPEYMEYFLKTQRFNFEMNNRLEGSVRLCLSFDGLSEIPIFIPTHEEQKSVVAKLIALDKKIEIEKQIENQYQQEKQYLLSKMFI